MDQIIEQALLVANKADKCTLERMQLGGVGVPPMWPTAWSEGSSQPCADEMWLSSQESRYSVSMTRGQAAQI